MKIDTPGCSKILYPNTGDEFIAGTINKIQPAQSEQLDRLNFRTVKAWWNGCVETEFKEEKETHAFYAFTS